VRGSQRVAEAWWVEHGLPRRLGRPQSREAGGDLEATCRPTMMPSYFALVSAKLRDLVRPDDPPLAIAAGPSLPLVGE